jgi:LacI family transcriptional regulator
MGQITIKDIARKLNLSASTVSRALRNHPDISPETKRKIVALAEQYDYHPNSIAQSLQTRKSRTIGIIVPEIKHHFFSFAISGIDEVAYEAGYTIMVCQSSESYDREVINTQALLSHRVAGLLVSVSQETREIGHLESAVRRSVPLVLFDRVCETLPVSRVMVDDYQGAYQATTHLVQQGYRRIAHLAGPAYISIGRQRFKGYRDALKDNGREFDPELVIAGGFKERDGAVAAARILTMVAPPDAIFAVNDPVAIGAFMHIKEAGLVIPDDMAVVGFSNNPISSYIEPALTTIDQPAYEIGKAAANLLLEEIRAETENRTPTVKTFPTRLIVRASS